MSPGKRPNGSLRSQGHARPTAQIATPRRINARCTSSPLRIRFCLHLGVHAMRPVQTLKSLLSAIWHGVACKVKAPRPMRSTTAEPLISRPQPPAKLDRIHHFRASGSGDVAAFLRISAAHGICACICVTLPSSPRRCIAGPSKSWNFSHSSPRSRGIPRYFK